MLGSQNMTDIKSCWELVWNFWACWFPTISNVNICSWLTMTIAYPQTQIFTGRWHSHNSFQKMLWDAQWLPITLKVNSVSFQAQGIHRICPCSSQATLAATRAPPCPELQPFWPPCAPSSSVTSWPSCLSRHSTLLLTVLFANCGLPHRM